MSRDRRQRSKQRLRRKAGEGAGELVRADVPGALDHASGDVDEFDAALLRGAGGVPVPEADVEQAETSTERAPASVTEPAQGGDSGTPTAAMAQSETAAVTKAAAGASRPVSRRGRPGPADRSSFARRPSCAPAGQSFNASNGPTARRSSRPRRSSWASSRSWASTSASPTGLPKRSSTSSSEPR